MLTVFLKIFEMTQLIVAFLSGLLFTVGLIVSGMSNPAKVLNFLDIARSWDPTLAFVMGSNRRSNRE